MSEKQTLSRTCLIAQILKNNHKSLKNKNFVRLKGGGNERVHYAERLAYHMHFINYEYNIPKRKNAEGK